MEDDRLATNLGPEIPDDLRTEVEPSTKQPKRRFVGKRIAERDAGTITSKVGIEDNTAVQAASPIRPTRALHAIPRDILEDEDINAAIGLLPPNYAFEIHKTIHRVRSADAKKVALQFPEGLLMFATTISDILTRFCTGIETLIMGDVTYGACCIDDYSARALGCDMLIHYAHSCLIPVNVTRIKTLYVFVDISIDIKHLRTTIEQNFQASKAIALVGTIQFNSTIHQIAADLRVHGWTIIVPQIAPLSKGEILGCTSPQLSVDTSTQKAADIILYVGDGRFHLESAMIQNPLIPAFKYDPYSRRLTRESYDHSELHDLRRTAVLAARYARKWGLILGTLGRQGNPHTLTLIESILAKQGVEVVRLALSEIFPGKLAMMADIECWVQVACPRLSIDWGYAFPRPLLSPYEALVALGLRDAGWMDDGCDGHAYPMDYYGKTGLGRADAKDVVAAAM